MKLSVVIITFNEEKHIRPARKRRNDNGGRLLFPVWDFFPTSNCRFNGSERFGDRIEPGALCPQCFGA